MSGFEISRRYTFEAAHKLTKVEPSHKCARLHGHSFGVEIFVVRDARGLILPPLDDEDMVVDFAAIDDVWMREAFSVLDHNYLNEIGGLENPTSENIAKWIYTEMNETLHRQHYTKITRIVVSETPRSSAGYVP